MTNQHSSTNLVRVLCFCMALVPGLSLAQQSWNPVGSSDMRWTFFKLYNITLLTDDGNYRPQQYPQALEIRYYRDIDKEDLVNATGDQWENLGIPKEKRNRWLPELSSLWPDVKKNDELRFEVDASGRNRFFYNGELIGSVDSPEFSQAFLAIWLSPDTSRPDLREKLIGAQTGNV